jgi:type II secretory pathway component PulF
MPFGSAASADDLASAARLLGYALEQATSTDEAFQHLREASTSRQQAVVQQLEGLIRARDSSDLTSRRLKVPAYSTLAWLLRQAPTPERSAAAFFGEFRRSESLRITAAAVMRSEFAGFLSYLGAVLGVLFVVLAMYNLYMLPQFKELYDAFGRQLPALTGFVFGGGAALYELALLLAVGLLAALWWFVYRLRRQLQCYEPMPGGYQAVPLIGRVALTYHQYLWLSYAALLHSAGVSADQSLRLAGTRLPPGCADLWGTAVSDMTLSQRSRDTEIVGNLTTAAQLGQLPQEMQFQQQATLDALLAALARCRRQARIALTVLIYVLVATYVSAMYLPIFSLGSTI